MKLAQALGLRPGETVAFTGAGGKTGAMFGLARELGGTIILTTTTHLGAWQAGLADQHIIVNGIEDIPPIESDQPQILLFTGPVNAENRLTPLPEDVLTEVHSRCTKIGIHFLIEADGARKRPLKAPAPYEPVVPDWVDLVVVVAGLSGVGKPLTEEWVHRPALFSGLTGLALGERISCQNLVDLLSSEAGGLQGIPAGARRVCFLNQADHALTQAMAQRMARQLSGIYERVLIGSLEKPAEDEPVFAVHSQIAGVILAAGGSERLGVPKQLLDWGGSPFITQIIKNALESRLMPLIVVTGAGHAEIEKACRDFPVRIVHNERWAEGQATSMQLGLAALPEDCQGVVFLLSDQPQVSPLLIRGLIERFSAHRNPITAPQIAGRRGNPVLFARETFDALRSVTGDRGGRAVMQQFKVDWLPWVDDRALLDVDQEGDLARLRSAYEVPRG